MCVIAVSISLCITAAVVWYYVSNSPSTNNQTPKKPGTQLSLINSSEIDQTIDITSIRNEVSRLWHLPFSSLPVCVDLARLASRVAIIDQRPNATIQFFTPQEMDALEKTSYIISTVANLVESPGKSEHITRIVYEQRSTDSRLWLESVFEEIGEECKTAQIFKVVNQTIIQPVCTSVKKMIFELINSIPTDVRTPDGWRVIIMFNKDNISVTHTRKEEIRGQFSFCWSLSILLNYDLMSLQDVTLTFNSMTYEESFPKQFKDKLNKYLGLTQ